MYLLVNNYFLPREGVPVDCSCSTCFGNPIPPWGMLKYMPCHWVPVQKRGSFPGSNLGSWNPCKDVGWFLTTGIFHIPCNDVSQTNGDLPSITPVGVLLESSRSVRFRIEWPRVPSRIVWLAIVRCIDAPSLPRCQKRMLRPGLNRPPRCGIKSYRRHYKRNRNVFFPSRFFCKAAIRSSET